MYIVTLSGVAAALIGYFLLRTIYRLYFHPLSKFPGPKLTAATHLYEFYYDVVKGGKFIWQIEKMHEKYGPIVRINPRELHIKDPQFFDELCTTRKTNKDPAIVPMFNIPESGFATRSAGNLEGLICEKMEKAVHLLEEAYRDGSIISIDGLTAALTADIISHYAYGQTSGILEDKSLKNDFRDAIMGIAHLGHLTRFFPIMASALDTLPPWLIKTLQPKLSGILDTRDRIMQQGVDAIKAEASHSGVRKKDSGKTIFETLSDKSVAPAERTPTRLRDEGLSLLVAGTETTSRSLSVGFFHILNNKDILRKLHEELKQVMATPKSTASWSQLERLPYLTAVINEALRLSHASMVRLPRIFPSDTITYKGYVIPPGTPVSHCHFFIHMDPTIFPDPEVFDPNRWIRATQNGERLSRFLVAFGKGTRVCLGMNLAYAELYHAFAAFVRRFDMEVCGTTYEENVKVTRDLVLGVPEHRDAIEVQVKVTGIVQD